MTEEKFNFNKEYAKLPKCPVCNYYLCDGARKHKRTEIINTLKKYPEYSRPIIFKIFSTEDLIKTLYSVQKIFKNSIKVD